MKSTKTFTDPAGIQIPAKYVSDYDKARDRTVRRIYELWEKTRKQLISCKVQTDAHLAAIRQIASKQSGISLGGEKGYFSLRSFDGKIIIRFENVSVAEFDERLELVQKLINEAIDDLAGDTSKNVNIQQLRKIAGAAFRPRGRSGKLDRQRVLDIVSLTVDHPSWKKAAELVRECDRVVGHRQYVRVAVQENPKADPVPVILDIAKV